MKGLFNSMTLGCLVLSSAVAMAEAVDPCQDAVLNQVALAHGASISENLSLLDLSQADTHCAIYNRVCAHLLNDLAVGETVLMSLTSDESLSHDAYIDSAVQGAIAHAASLSALDWLEVFAELPQPLRSQLDSDGGRTLFSAFVAYHKSQHAERCTDQGLGVLRRDCPVDANNSTSKSEITDVPCTDGPL